MAVFEDREHLVMDYSHHEYLGGGMKEVELIVNDALSRHDLKWINLDGNAEQELIYENRVPLNEDARLLVLIGVYGEGYFSEREINVIEEYVKSGGRLLVMPDGFGNKGPDPTRIIEPFGIRFTDEKVEDEQHHEGRHKDHVIISNFVEHIINEGVNSICFGDHGTVVLEISNPEARVLAFSDEDADPPFSPVTVLVPRGSGWVLSIGGMNWIKDKYIRQFDNIRWLRNIYEFLLSAPGP